MGMESARFAAAMGVGECTMCRLAPPQFDRAVAHANYEDEMRRMLHLLKFEGMRGIAEYVLGDAMAAAALKLRGDAARRVGGGSGSAVCALGRRRADSTRRRCWPRRW